MGSDLLAVGVVTSTHGVTGDLKVKTFSGTPDSLLALEGALFRKGGVDRTFRIRSVRTQGPGAIVGVEGIDSPEQARRLIGSEILVPREKAAPLSPGEFYEADLCGCTLWFGAEEIGPVRSVWEGGPVQLLEITGKDGKARLVPFTDHFVGTVDVAARRIELREDEIVR
jgi:16S rRNA processing protein RimM